MKYFSLRSSFFAPLPGNYCIVPKAKWQKMAIFAVDLQRAKNLRDTVSIMVLVAFKDPWGILDLFYAKNGFKNYLENEK